MIPSKYQFNGTALKTFYAQVLEMPISNRSVLACHLYRPSADRYLVDIRIWYISEEKYFPTTKGVRIPLELAEDLGRKLLHLAKLYLMSKLPDRTKKGLYL